MFTFSLVVVKINGTLNQKQDWLIFVVWLLLILIITIMLVNVISMMRVEDAPLRLSNFRRALILNRKKKPWGTGNSIFGSQFISPIFKLEFPITVVCTGHICQYLCGGHVISSSGRGWCPTDFVLLGQQRSSKHSILWWNQECGRKSSSCLLSSSPTVGRRQVRNVHI